MQDASQPLELLNSVAEFGEVHFFLIRGWLVRAVTVVMGWPCLVTTVVGQLLADMVQCPSSY